MPIPTPEATLLFTETDLEALLGGPVAADRAGIVERIVWGWLKPVTGLVDRPSPVPEELFSWAIELGGIAHENPAGLSSKQLGPAQQAFSSERRDEILRQAAAGGVAASALAPRGSFPPAQTYPDPACW